MGPLTDFTLLEISYLALVRGQIFLVYISGGPTDQHKMITPGWSFTLRPTSLIQDDDPERGMISRLNAKVNVDLSNHSKYNTTAQC